MAVHEGGRRRIDLVLSAGFAEGLTGLDMAEIRARRVEAEQEETDLSYARRLLHGRLDLLRAERERRSDPDRVDGPRSTDQLVADLSRVLADTPTGSHGLGRHGMSEPSRVGEHRRKAEAAVADPVLSDPQGLGDADLDAAVAHLDELARGVGEQRGEVQHVVDALSAEIGRRYRDGLVNVADVLPTEGSAAT